MAYEQRLLVTLPAAPVLASDTDKGPPRGGFGEEKR